MQDYDVDPGKRFADRQLLREEEREIMVAGTGNSLEDVVGNLFQGMRRQVFSQTDHPIIQMEAKAFYFQEVKVKTRTERFLFLFMPRQRQYFTVTARILVKIKYLEISKKDFAYV